jgi:acyl transferase domain-containing protein/NAD(P)H-dependent flavin oxidoreductase YrpB (nitropropane dioxygenase family)/NADP-dependent 3-hydroxy acid dehydrogenase YdfG
MNRPFEIICLSPPGHPDPAIPVAASRAGAVGVLDLAFGGEAAAGAIATLGRLGRGACGLRLDAGAGAFIDAVTRDLPQTFDTAILAHEAGADLDGMVLLLKSRRLRVAIEVTDLGGARAALAAGADVLVLRGHEAAGRVGDETSFILLQRLAAALPDAVLWVQGGVGLHSAAACLAGGAAGVVLDMQLGLTRESPLPEAVRAALERMDGSETVLVGGELGEPWRVYERPGASAVEALRRRAADIAAAAPAGSAGAARRLFRRALLEAIGWGPLDTRIWPVGQDAAFAAPLARRYRTVGGVVAAVRDAAAGHLAAARAARPLDAGSSLARSQGTRYPIVQGPMTRVSDTAAFADAVARGGGLPFLALALMRAPEVRALLEETRRTLGDRPWGVGILGFVPAELRDEQMTEIRACPPRYALIAGGRPDQARTLEEDGIPTWLHVPSPGLLRLFLENGSRRFVFEGRECGGHVGPRSSFVLWETMVETLLESVPAPAFPEVQVLFAGGVHDARSAAMVAALAAPLAEKGAQIGVLLGTAYLFTTEAVSCGAIVPGFQEEAIRCDRTVLLESGPGHSTRCAATPFADLFEQERRRLQGDGVGAEEARLALEGLNLGRLRVASKGVDRNPAHGRDPKAPRLHRVEPPEQRERGMYMIGQVAALRNRACMIAELHEDVSVRGTERLAATAGIPAAAADGRGREKPSDIAIVGMACLLPKAPDLGTYWHNILDKVDAITEIPASRWESTRWFDADRQAKDRVYSKWGGFIDPIPFDPTRFGMPPNALPSIEPLQLLTLEVVRAALADAGYLDRPYARPRTSVVLGAGGGVSDLGSFYGFRATLPMFFDNVPEPVLDRLPEWTEDSFPGILLNVAAGRVANRFDLGGVNCTIDAACASSLAAIYLAAKELETGTSDVVIAGGVDTAQNPFTYLCFSKTQALSPSGRCRTFDENSDGIAISEGIAVVVLKRLEDAERDGDRIYAVLKAIAGSSDGRERGLTAPRPEGQMLAVRRAYAKAGFSPATVGLIEAHGTGTVAGDRAEVETLRRVFEAEGAARQETAIGSVKSMIGHTKCSAGVAGMIKVAMALHHKVLPATLHVKKPNPKAGFPESPFYVNSETRPWLDGGGRPRRAGVSAFGFGGTNFHAVLEEYRDELALPSRPAVDPAWPAELYVLRAATRDDLGRAVSRLAEALAGGARPQPADLGRALWRDARRVPAGAPTAAIVASSPEDLAAKLAIAGGWIAAGRAEGHDLSGVHYRETPLGGKVAFLFPGQGSQSVDMLRDLAVHLPEVRTAFERADAALAGRYDRPLSRFVYPPPSFSAEEEEARQRDLTATQVAQPALGAAAMGLYGWLAGLGLRPDMIAGHSYGEYAALAAAGVFDERTLAHLSETRGRSIREAARGDQGTMAAVADSAARIVDVLGPLVSGPGATVWIANLNAPKQTAISGSAEAIGRALERLGAAGITARMLPVACGFHSPLVAPARDRLAQALAATPLRAPAMPVYSNALAAPYPDDPAAILSVLSEHLVKPVRFVDELEAMYAAGARIFVEVGPRNVLTGLAQQTLGGRGIVAVACDVPGHPGLPQLLHTLAQVVAAGATLDPDALYRGRATRDLRLATLVADTRERPLSPATWMVDGGHARPLKPAPRAPAPAPSSPPAPAGAIRAAAPASPPAPGAVVPAIPVAAVPAAVPRAVPATTTPFESAAGSTAMTALPSAPVAAGGADATRVMLEFQRFMQTFLETQQQVLLAYLQGGALPPALPVMVADATAATAHPAAAGPTPAVLAIPDVPAPQAAAAIETAPLAEAPMTTPDDVLRTLLPIVSERTGYPPDMLDPALNLEADLGIDSIKRVEILGALQNAIGPFPPNAMEGMSRLKTLHEIAGYLSRTVVGAAGASTAAVAVPPAIAAAVAPGPGVAPEASAGAASVPATGGAATGPVDREAILALLLRIVAERTGYPEEMLGLDLDLEADLGIDSIKRVEILGAYQQTGGTGEQKRQQDQMDRLTRSKTLRALVESLATTSQETGPATPPVAAATIAPTPAAAAPPAAASAAGAGAATAVAPAPRFVMVPVEAPQDPPAHPLPTDGVVLITDDGTGIAAALARDVRRLGSRPVILSAGIVPALVGEGLYAAPFDEPAALESVLAQMRAEAGPVRAIVHLLPLRKGDTFAAGDDDAWRRRVREEVRGLFLLARAAHPDLTCAPGGRIVAVSGLGGSLLHGAGGPAFDPRHGGLAGLVKVFAIEWPEVSCRVVDLDPGAERETIASWVLQEASAGDAEIEVGRGPGGRVVLRPAAADLEPAASPATTLPPDPVVLVTGGGRGITASVLEALAGVCRPTYILVGRTPFPDGDEDRATAGLTAMADLKGALLQAMRGRGETATPAKVEAAYARLLREREMRRAMAGLRAAGAEVRYHAADVRDDGAFGRLIESVYRDHGRIDGVVHGAGLIEDKLVLDKSLESFDRVFETKVSGALTLARRLRPQSLRFLVFFTSVAGRFGNRGQVDYAAANEVVNKLAVWLDRRIPAHVMALNWGPWGVTGMASAEVQRQFEARGVRLVEPAAGKAAFVSEILAGRKGEVETILGGGPWEKHLVPRPAGTASRVQAGPATATATRVGGVQPLLAGLRPTVAPGGGVEITRLLDPAADLYLIDHVLDGNPVLPAAMALELMAEAAAEGWPGFTVAGIRDFRVLKGIVVENGPRPLRILARAQTHAPTEGLGMAVDVEIAPPGHKGPPNYRATILLADRAPAPPPDPEALMLGGLGPFPMPLDEAYRKWLFHGPLFAAIRRIDGMGSHGLVGTLEPSSPSRCLAGAPAGAWIIDPVVLDATFQMAVLWERHHFDLTPLPTRFTAYHRFGSLSTPGVRCHVATRTSADGAVLVTRHLFLAPDSGVLGLLEGMEASCSRALNRLSDDPTARVPRLARETR